jgi:hypothetical protein
MMDKEIEDKARAIVDKHYPEYEDFIDFARWLGERWAGKCEQVYGGLAHTYASENAAIYRAQDIALESCASMIREDLT